MIALRVLAVFIAVGVVAMVGSLIIVGLQLGVDYLEVSRLVITPFTAILAYLGTVDGTPVLLTGVLILVLALRWGVRGVDIEASVVDDRIRVLALAAKVAIVLTGAMLVIAIITDVFNLIPSGTPGARIGLTAGGFGVDYVRIVFVSAPVVAAATFVVLARHVQRPVLAVLGLSVTTPGLVVTSWTGTRRMLRVGLIGILVLYTIGTMLTMLTRGFGDVTGLLATLFGLLLFGAILAAVDLAVLVFVDSMAFLQANLLGPTSAWQWVGVLLVAVAFFLGGRAAAQRAAPDSVAQAITAASLVGVLTAGLGVLVAINYGGLAGLPEVAAPAILLPLLWTIFAIVGAWWFANERNLPSGVAVQSAPQTPAPPAPPPQPPAPDALPAPRAPPTPPDGDDLPPPSGPRRM